MDILAAWQKAQEPLQTRVGNTSYTTWFSAIHIKPRNEQILVIETPDDFFKNWIKDHYVTTIETVLSEVAGRIISVELEVNPNIITPETRDRLSPLEKDFPTTLQPACFRIKRKVYF